MLSSAQVERPPQALVVGASSDIGAAICRRWLERGWRLAGTYRTGSEAVDELRGLGMELVHCDLARPEAIRPACERLASALGTWDLLLLGPGALEPVGLFSEVEFEGWESSLQVNLVGQLAAVHALLPSRRLGTAR